MERGSATAGSGGAAGDGAPRGEAAPLVVTALVRRGTEGLSGLGGSAWAGLVELLWPRSCAGCGARSVRGPFCAPCSATLEPIAIARCVRCSEPLPGRGWSLRPEQSRSAPAACATCAVDPPPFSTVVAPFVHGGAIATAIHRLKYRGRREVAHVLAPLLVAPATGALDGIELVAPIPLHPARRRERGYDHALLLASECARLAGLPLAPRALTRLRHTAPQVGRSRAERRSATSGVFGAAPVVVGKRLLLVDDVVTTGATARAAAGAALAAGAREVLVLAVARAG